MAPLVKRKENWKETAGNFTWQVPQFFNIAQAACDRHAQDASKPALIHETESGTVETWTFRMLQQAANRLANALEGLGLKPGDCVGIILPQCPETGIAHMGLYKMGAVALPLANLFGPEALKYRLSDSGAKVVITDAENRQKIEEIRDDVPELKLLIQISEPVENGVGALRR